MYFSTFANQFPAPKNRLYSRKKKLAEANHQFIDLISGNVNEQGLVFPQSLLSDILSKAAEDATTYKPEPLGQQCAREAIAFHSRSGTTEQQILLTPGTSVAYWYCFKVLCETSDEVLCPSPSYPLFEYIANLCGVRIKHYRLNEEENWAIDFDHLESNITKKTRAIIVISPHNPTGMVVDHLQADKLSEIAQRHNLPIIADEVFRKFVFQNEGPRLPSVSGPLVFTLNGFSKMFALPGLKIAWMEISGETDFIKKALSALEIISDSFLPVNEIAQFAVPAIFQQGEPFLAQYQAQIRKRRDTALSELRGLQFVRPSGGFYLVLPYQRDIDDEDLAIELLEDEGILVHPGYFYEIENSHLVFSFTQRTTILKDCLGRLRAHL